MLRLLTPAAKWLVVLAAVALGVLFAFGFVLAALFEVQGFGSRDSDPSTRYLIVLAAGFVACVVIPVLLWRRLVPVGAPGWLLASAIAAAGVLLILGISLRGS